MGQAPLHVGQSRQEDRLELMVEQAGADGFPVRPEAHVEEGPGREVASRQRTMGRSVGHVLLLGRADDLAVRVEFREFRHGLGKKRCECGSKSAAPCRSKSAALPTANPLPSGVPSDPDSGRQECSPTWNSGRKQQRVARISPPCSGRRDARCRRRAELDGRAGSVEPGQAELRSKTSSSMAAPVRSHTPSRWFCAA